MSKKYEKSFFEKNKLTFITIAIALVIIGLILGIGSASDSNKKDFDSRIYGDDAVEMIYFHWTQCSHCKKQNAFLEDVLYDKYPNLKVTKYEITDPTTKDKYEEIAQKFDELPNDWNKFPGTPLTIIGDRTNGGFGDASTTGQVLIEMIEEEMAKIEANWDEETMIRTQTLRDNQN